MYRQQSLITLDQFYEMKPLTKLEAVLSFIDYSLLRNSSLMILIEEDQKVIPKAVIHYSYGYAGRAIIRYKGISITP